MMYDLGVRQPVGGPVSERSFPAGTKLALNGLALTLIVLTKL